MRVQSKYLSDDNSGKRIYTITASNHCAANKTSCDNVAAHMRVLSTGF